MTRFIDRWLVSLGLSLMLLNPFAGQAAAQTGWWWNANEAGRGFFIEVVGDWMFLSGYFYDADGRPTWLVSNDPMPDPRAYDGRLLSFGGGQGLTGGYRAPGARPSPGNIHLQFIDDAHAAMTWPGGVVALERYDFHHATASTFVPQAGWWWNPDESGRGFSVELQGDHMFIGAYMYDPDGTPVWFVADDMMKSATRFEAPLLRFSNGQTLTGGYRHPDGPAVAGTIVIDFSAADRATVTLSDQAGTKGFETFEVQPQKKKPARPVPTEVTRPQFLDGSFSQIVTFTQETAVIEMKATITWKQSDVVPIPYDGSTTYVVQVASATTTIHGAIDLGDEICDVFAQENTELTQNNGSIYVGTDGRYSGEIHFNAELHTLPCGKMFNVPFPMTMALSGLMVDDGQNMRGAPPVPPGQPAVASRWEFLGRE
jgi:hypothetical protein